MSSPTHIANHSIPDDNPIPVKTSSTVELDVIIEDIVLENITFTLNDDVDFSISGTQSDVNISSTVANAFNNVTTANIVSIVSDVDFIMKINGSGNSGRTYKANVEYTRDQVTATNLFITTTATTVFSLTLQGES